MKPTLRVISATLIGLAISIQVAAHWHEIIVAGTALNYRLHHSDYFATASRWVR